MGELVWEKRQFGHRARLALTPAQVRLMDDQAHAARGAFPLERGHPDHWIVMIHRTGVPVGDVEVLA
ncbi:hypothetical protein [Streptomyces sp. NBC_00145]|uniref:hypothetical protein n=1 Tax=Streptomyces sp. NBC_00145 TaxID=2975666 RepID=UPI002E171F86